MSNQLLTAAEFAKVCHVTPRTVRWYQQIGILKPIKIDKGNKYAYFTPQQSLDMFKIKLLQRLNIPLKESKTRIRNNLSFNKEIQKMEQFIEEKQKEVKFLKNLNFILYNKNAGTLLTKNLFGSHNLFCLKIENGDYHKINFYLNQLKKTADDFKIKLEGDGIVFYIDHELKYKPKNTPLEIAFIIKSKTKKINSLPMNYYIKHQTKINCLSYTLSAPNTYFHDIYLPLVYKKLDKFMFNSKIKIKGKVFEVYSKTFTKICYQI